MRNSILAFVLAVLLQLTGAALEALHGVSSATALDQTSPFATLPGLWTGQGRLGFKDGKTEGVTCRATYFIGDSEHALRQTIRCATPSGKIELKSTVSEANGTLAGTWAEEMYNLSGDISGSVTATGFRVIVKGADLDANMDIIVRGNKQIVEIQFHNTTLVGMTMVLDRATSADRGES